MISFLMVLNSSAMTTASLSKSLMNRQRNSMISILPRPTLTAVIFYFEIDREDDFRRKGPSKENRKDPIVGLGLLLDANQIPIGMELFPGNESEKPILRNVIKKLKDKNQITGKTIHVADKGLNCAQNIAFSKENGDGYLFSKSVKSLPEKEKNMGNCWIMMDWKDVRSRGGTLLYRYKSCVEKNFHTLLNRW